MGCSHAVPIERHAIRSAQRTIALLTPEAEFVGSRLPRIDSPALSAEHWRLTEAIVRAVALRWQEPDHGI